METKPATTDYTVDVVRFIAIGLVILLHSVGSPYQFQNADTTAIDILNWFSTDVYGALGMLGVPLFVMLTGALLLNPNKDNEPLGVFYRKRLDRIALPFVFWTIIYFAWTFTVLGRPLTLQTLGQGLLAGSYYHLWYLYLLMGLYAVTPILRVLVKHLNRKLFAYLLILWFTGTVSTPFIHTFTDFEFSPVAFVFFDWVGYYLLGLYLLESKIRRSKAYLIAFGGLLGAIVGEWFLTATTGQQYMGFFHNYMSATIIIASAGFFFVLLSWNTNRLGNYPILHRVIHWVSMNTLPIYLIHMLVLVTLTTNVLGVWLNTLTFIRLVDVPVYAAIVFAVSAGIIYVLKKIPYLKKLVG